ncbi:MAG: hypothetical protein AB3N14_01255 [Flavobacteriaceae bacterium]
MKKVSIILILLIGIIQGCSESTVISDREIKIIALSSEARDAFEEKNFEVAEDKYLELLTLLRETDESENVVLVDEGIEAKCMIFLYEIYFSRDQLQDAEIMKNKVLELGALDRWFDVNRNDFNSFDSYFEALRNELSTKRLLVQQVAGGDATR